MAAACDSILPVEIWAVCLSFLCKDEEFHVAQVCKDWYKLLKHQRQKRKECVWRTSFTLYCTSDARFEYACRHSGCDVSAQNPTALFDPSSGAVDLALVKAAPLSVLKAAHKLGSPLDCVTTWAARRGSLAVLEWASENGCYWGPGTCAAAAKEGHFEVLKWARQNGCPWDKWTCCRAAQGGHLAVLQWAITNSCPISLPDLSKLAVHPYIAPHIKAWLTQHIAAQQA